jgi:hypothetical protein
MQPEKAISTLVTKNIYTLVGKKQSVHKLKKAVCTNVQ